MVEHNKKSVLLKIEELRKELSSIVQKYDLNGKMTIEDMFNVVNLEEEILRLETESMILDLNSSRDKFK